MVKQPTKTQKARPPLKLKREPKRLIAQVKNLPRDENGYITGGKGRPRGVPNKLSAEIKEAFIEAVKRAGNCKTKKQYKEGLEAYFYEVALTRKDLTMAMMGRLLPMEANVKHENRSAVNVKYETVADLLEEFKRRKVPVELWPPILRAEHEKTLKRVEDVNRTATVENVVGRISQVNLAADR
ncbi:MAG: hypothetical protein E7813_02520 [Bradyrhizobium sp.]|uniref:hypothetical protein n=1 Tax=Bradyrhizobium sp. TaxID=376 RepID=UPI00120E616C|nr:hypothetical protein [Bradyrhizobium sp.]THD73656.1 MAG: hypothetical protein E7813_02520 [Bradyrhizobium sp.]